MKKLGPFDSIDANKLILSKTYWDNASYYVKSLNPNDAYFSSEL